MLATTIHKSNTTPHHQSRATTRPPKPQPQENGLVASKPNSVSDDFPPARAPQRGRPLTTGKFVVHQNPPHYRVKPIQRIAQESGSPRTMRAGLSLVVLLRKEVIQPHLPVRLPCYDFVPIADPTFDGSLPYGLGHRLRVLPTFMT